MRRVRYVVAMSLDGYIAGPHGESDWIVADPEVDFGKLFAGFDTALMGRVTYEAVARAGPGSMQGLRSIVFSRTLRQSDHPDVTIIADSPREAVADLQSKRGKDLWLFGGGSLFRSFLELQLVNTVEVAVIPVLLGKGIPLLPAPAPRVGLRLTGNRLYKASGIMVLEYDVEYGAA